MLKLKIRAIEIVKKLKSLKINRTLYATVENHL